MTNIFTLQLIQKAEDKLMSVLPVKERMQILRMKTQVTPAEIQEASAELDEWQECVEVLDCELRGKGSPPKRGKTLPPVRGTKREKLDVPQAKPVPAGGDSAGKSSSKAKERISGYNFPAWEKFDVDAAINEIDENESEAEKAKRVAAADAQKRAAEAVRQRALRHQKELDVFREEMKTSMSFDYMLLVREKQKGNEAFRAGENDEAYAFYSRSLALDDSSAVVYTNRAVLAIRMNKLETAVDDSSRAIALDPSYMKAYYRRGVARLKLGQTGDAIVDFQEALRKDPANKELTALLVKAKNKYQEVEGREFGAPTPPASVATAKNEDITTRVAVRVVSSAELLYLPAGERSVLASGALQEVIETDEDMQGGFTRIQIQDTDSEDEEEQECGKGVAEDTQVWIY
ncbi:RPAP3 [Symbiodinium microadriaticum]|nr:RPAP3 [Symbiodinium microadriaticum]